MGFLGINSQPAIQLYDGRCRLKPWLPGKRAGWKNGRHSYLDMMRARQIYHRDDVVFKVLFGRGASIAGNIVRTSHDVHNLGPQLNHILKESQQDLGRSLTTDAPSDHPIAKQLRVTAYPVLSDGISNENDLRWCRQCRVGAPILAQIWPISFRTLFCGLEIRLHLWIGQKLRKTRRWTRVQCTVDRMCEYFRKW